VLLGALELSQESRHSVDQDRCESIGDVFLDPILEQLTTIASVCSAGPSDCSDQFARWRTSIVLDRHERL
jgi:hypothetical protein